VPSSEDRMSTRVSNRQEQTPAIAYLGPSIDHRNALVDSFAAIGVSVISVLDSGSWRQTQRDVESGGAFQRVTRIADQFRGTRDSAYLSYATKLLDEHAIDTVVAYWGTLPLPDLVALKKLRPRTHFVLNVLCHPLGLTYTRVALQNLIFSNAVSCIDGLVLSSTAMKEYVQAKVVRGRQLPMLVQPPCWTSNLFATHPAARAVERPNMVFLGRMDWKRAQPSDNVNAFLLEVMDQGIDVHFGRSRDGGLDHRHAKPFDPVPLAIMTGFAAQFDASLIVYNMAAVDRTDRFENTVPDRLISSVCLGIPIAIPEQGFSACKEYLQEYGGFFLYDSPSNLAEQLRDTDRMDGLRSAAQANFRKYSAEAHAPKLLEFLSSLSR
jgi:hypothetical protein